MPHAIAIGDAANEAMTAATGGDDDETIGGAERTSKGAWSEVELSKFKEGLVAHGWGNWRLVRRDFVPTRSGVQIKKRARVFRNRHPAECEGLERRHEELRNMRPKVEGRRGVWSEAEHSRFEEGIAARGWGQWCLISEEYVPTRSKEQIRDHARLFRRRHAAEYEALVSGGRRREGPSDDPPSTAAKGAETSNGTSTGVSELEEEDDPEREAFDALVKSICAICIKKNATGEEDVRKMVDKYKPRYPGLTVEMIGEGIKRELKTDNDVIERASYEFHTENENATADAMRTSRREAAVAGGQEEGGGVVVKGAEDERVVFSARGVEIYGSTDGWLCESALRLGLGRRVPDADGARDVGEAADGEARGRKRPPTSPAEKGAAPKKRKRRTRPFACPFEGCTVTLSSQGFCTAHGGDRKKRRIPKKLEELVPRGINGWIPTETCSVEGCNMWLSVEGLCGKHGGKRPRKKYICKADGCTLKAMLEGLCRRHSPKRVDKECTVEGCTRNRRKGGVCVEHGASYSQRKCKHEGCPHFAVRGGVCRKHGAEPRKCSHEGCTSQVENSGLCRRHGARVKLCSVEGCTTQAKRKGLCQRHGGRRLCSVKGCTNQTWSKGSLCVGHCERKPQPRSDDHCEANVGRKMDASTNHDTSGAESDGTRGWMKKASRRPERPTSAFDLWRVRRRIVEEEREVVASAKKSIMSSDSHVESLTDQAEPKSAWEAYQLEMAELESAAAGNHNDETDEDDGRPNDDCDGDPVSLAIRQDELTDTADFEWGGESLYSAAEGQCNEDERQTNGEGPGLKPGKQNDVTMK